MQSCRTPPPPHTHLQPPPPSPPQPMCVCSPSLSPITACLSTSPAFQLSITTTPTPSTTTTLLLLFLLTTAAHLIPEVFPEKQREQEHLGVMSWCSGIQEHTLLGKHTDTHRQTHHQRRSSHSLCLTHTEHFFHLKTRNTSLTQSEIPQH